MTCQLHINIWEKKKAHKHKLFALVNVQMALGQTAGCPRVNRAKRFMCAPQNRGKINFSLWLTGRLSQGCPDFQKSRTKNQPKEEVFGPDIPRTSGGHSRGYPGPKLRSGRSKSWKNKHLGADIHDPKVRTSTTLRDFQKLRSEKLWAEFSFPKKVYVFKVYVPFSCSPTCFGNSCPRKFIARIRLRYSKEDYLRWHICRVNFARKIVFELWIFFWKMLRNVPRIVFSISSVGQKKSSKIAATLPSKFPCGKYKNTDELLQERREKDYMRSRQKRCHSTKNVSGINFQN